MKKIALKTAEELRQIWGFDDGGWGLDRLRTEFEQMKQQVGANGPLADLVQGVRMHLDLLGDSLSFFEGKEPHIRVEAEMAADNAVNAALRFMALKTAVEWPQGGRTEDAEAWAFVRAEYAANPKRTVAAIVDEAVRKFPQTHGGRRLPLNRDYLCKHFKRRVKDIVRTRKAT